MDNQSKVFQDNIVQNSYAVLMEYLLEAENKYIESITGLSTQGLIDERRQNKDDSWKIIRGTGYFALSLNKLFDSLTYLKQKDMILSNANFLDMGCGLGLNSIVAANQGLNIYGIEINPVLVEGSKQIIQGCKEDNIIDSQIICRIVQGNYFPEEYRILRQNNQSEAVLSEEKYYRDNTRTWRSIKSVSTQPKAFLYPKTDEHDAYKELDVSLKDIDIMYSYCWAVNVPSILEIFSKYTKNDAMLLIDSAGMPRDMDRLLKNLNLSYNFDKHPYYIANEYFPMNIVTKNIQS